MVCRPAAGNLQSMFTTSAPRIRDEPAAYGPHEVEGDDFPASAVLDDLIRAPDGDVPRIVARYAVVRSWLLRDLGADPVVTGDAAASAARYLSAVEDWPEAAPLRRLAGCDAPLAAAWEAARHASAAGHTEGAYALLRTAYLAARRRSDIAWAARLADGIARLLEAAGMDGTTLWARRAARLRRLLDRT